ncbi:MAG: butyrate kinase [Candidatus Marinimicrobia bacterium]|nr:butyrate kinase [Candidatus Neomarinimicrobiota bacterium]
MNQEVVLTINPGSTSTKIGLFNREKEICVEKIDHSGTPIADMHSIKDQLPLRSKYINAVLEKYLKDNKLVAVVGRGGLVGPVKSGIYAVNEDLMDVTINCLYDTHASNLGASLAYEVAQKYQVPSFIVDPVTVDEMTPEARISGLPEIERRSRLHALNINAVVRKTCRDLQIKKESSNFIVVHMGGGISVAPICHGRIIDTNDALVGMGPFSPERAGALPLEGLMRLCQNYSFNELKIKLTKNAGIKAYLGTNDMQEVIKRVENGDEKATLVYNAMIYQIAKEIGAMATTLKGKIDAIIFTGGMAYADLTIKKLWERVSFICHQKVVIPGENELESLAQGGFLAIDQKQEILVYKKTI